MREHAACHIVLILRIGIGGGYVPVQATLRTSTKHRTQTECQTRVHERVSWSHLHDNSVMQVGALGDHMRFVVARVDGARRLRWAGAARVGLYDQSQLHRHFKRIAGVTPVSTSERCAEPKHCSKNVP